jgi:hypothetical protein
MTFITKLGPVNTSEGPCYFYLALDPDEVAAAQTAANDTEGFARLKAVLQGDVVCDKSLAKAAKKHGLPTGPLPPWAVVPRLSLAMTLAQGTQVPDFSACGEPKRRSSSKRRQTTAPGKELSKVASWVAEERNTAWRCTGRKAACSG